jgi:hypothetical protein
LQNRADPFQLCPLICQIRAFRQFWPISPVNKLRVRSALAMRIANVDRQKFNEAVSNGHCPCAPSTTAGSVRLFSEDDLVVLYVFARLLELQMLPRMAGRLACEFRDEMRSSSSNGSDRIVFVKSENMSHFFSSKHYEPDHEANGRHYPGIGRVILSIDFYVGTIRSVIAARIEDERSILGREVEDD